MHWWSFKHLRQPTTKKDGGEGKKQGGVEELGSSQSSGTEHGVLVGKRDGLMRLLARQELMMMSTYNWPKDNICTRLIHRWPPLFLFVCIWKIISCRNVVVTRRTKYGLWFTKVIVLRYSVTQEKTTGKSGIHLWIRSKDHDMIGSILRGNCKTATKELNKQSFLWLD